MRGHNYNIVLEIKVAPFTVIRAFRFHNGTMLRFEYVATYKDTFPYISDRKQNFPRFPQCQEISQSQEILGKYIAIYVLSIGDRSQVWYSVHS